MKTARETGKWKFVAGSKIISKPGAAIVVKELILTERGRQAITSGSNGIREGVAKETSPNQSKKGMLEPA